jgi:hypothetical protein
VLVCLRDGRRLGTAIRSAYSGQRTRAEGELGIAAPTGECSAHFAVRPKMPNGPTVNTRQLATGFQLAIEKPTEPDKMAGPNCSGDPASAAIDHGRSR